MAPQKKSRSKKKTTVKKPLSVEAISPACENKTCTPSCRSDVADFWSSVKQVYCNKYYMLLLSFSAGALVGSLATYLTKK